jgi:hypothetical protein
VTAAATENVSLDAKKRIRTKPSQSTAGEAADIGGFWCAFARLVRPTF